MMFRTQASFVIVSQLCKKGKSLVVSELEGGKLGESKVTLRFLGRNFEGSPALRLLRPVARRRRGAVSYTHLTLPTKA